MGLVIEEKRVVVTVDRGVAIKHGDGCVDVPGVRVVHLELACGSQVRACTIEIEPWAVEVQAVARNATLPQGPSIHFEGTKMDDPVAVRKAMDEWWDRRFAAPAPTDG